jgi:hypothetical protein
MTDDRLAEDRLLAVLRAVFADEHEVPPSTFAGAQAVLSWQSFDEELELLFDSATVPAALTRAAPAARQLIFGAAGLTIECELTGDEFVGQVLPPIADRVFLLMPPTGTGAAVPVDPQGWFTIQPTPPGPLSLRLTVPGRRDLVTPWLWP